MYQGRKSTTPDFSKMDLDELNARLRTVNTAIQRLNSDISSPVSFQEGGFRMLKNQITSEICKKVLCSATSDLAEILTEVLRTRLNNVQTQLASIGANNNHPLSYLQSTYESIKKLIEEEMVKRPEEEMNDSVENTASSPSLV